MLLHYKEVEILSELLTEEMRALVEADIYPDEKTLKAEAFRALLRLRPSLKIESAIQFYFSGSVSFSRAAEIAGVSAEEMKEYLADRGKQREILPSPPDVFEKALKFIERNQS